MHQAERWRDRLLADDGALTDFITDHPGADVQWLRATIRAARREHDRQAPPKHARELYRWLRQRMGAPTDHES
jgi:ribosome-associated protein